MDFVVGGGVREFELESVASAPANNEQVEFCSTMSRPNIRVPFRTQDSDDLFHREAFPEQAKPRMNLKYTNATP